MTRIRPSEPSQARRFVEASAERFCPHYETIMEGECDCECNQKHAPERFERWWREVGE